MSATNCCCRWCRGWPLLCVRKISRCLSGRRWLVSSLNVLLLVTACIVVTLLLMSEPAKITEVIGYWPGTKYATGDLPVILAGYERTALSRYNDDLRRLLNLTQSPGYSYAPKSPGETIQCFGGLARSYLQLLSSTRETVLNRAMKRPYTDVIQRGKHSILQAENQSYFEELRQYPTFLTLRFNASVEQVQKCSNPEYYPNYGANICSKILELAKRGTQFDHSVYGLGCVEDAGSVFSPSPIHPFALQLGLPMSYKQGPVKTLTYIHVVDNCLITEYGDILHKQVDISIQRCYPNRKATGLKYAKTYDEVFSIAQYFGDGMFHGNIEELSRIALYIPWLKEHVHIKIHMTAQIPAFFSILGFPASRVVTGNVIAKVAYVPAGTPCCLPTFVPMTLMSAYMRISLPNNWRDRDTIILIKRSHRRNRYFGQHEKIKSMLDAAADHYGMNVWVFEDDPVPPLPEVMLQFNHAALVVAPHGAGETNLLFAQPRTALVEGLCFDFDDGKLNLVYRNLIHILGGFYYGFYKMSQHCVGMKAEDLIGPVLYFLEKFDQQKRPS